MENALLIAVAVLPLGLVAVSACLMLKRRSKKQPKLEIVPIPDAPSVSVAPLKKKATKKKSRRGKRK